MVEARRKRGYEQQEFLKKLEEQLERLEEDFEQSYEENLRLILSSELSLILRDRKREVMPPLVPLDLGSTQGDHDHRRCQLWLRSVDEQIVAFARTPAEARMLWGRVMRTMAERLYDTLSRGHRAEEIMEPEKLYGGHKPDEQVNWN